MRVWRKRALIALALTGLGCADSGPNDPAGTPSSTRQYGTPVELGNGRARVYVVRDAQTGHPTEVGVALDEAALVGLPEGGNLGGGGHEHYNSYILELPARHGTPYQFVELDWNPKGHGGPYVAPHFDFHFYRISVAERNAIDPSDPRYADRAANLPAKEEMPAGYAAHHALMGITPVQAVVPRMGLHWIDLSSPELPPRNKPFTATFIVGSWDGRVIFDEPMITRAFILSQRDVPGASDSIIPVPSSQKYTPAGFYMTGYRASWDPAAKEFRIALTGLQARY
ncbi:MAG: DUF5602 domain-containing protein [Gemmatimonadales bacterium]